MKSTTNNLAVFGAEPVFDTIRSCSNLVRPDIETFLKYFVGSTRTDWRVYLEHKLSELHDTKYCVMFCNGLWALIHSIKATACAGKHEVIIPAMTYRRLDDAVAWTGFTPHFCDIDKKMLGVTVNTIAPCINEHTALILVPQPIVNVCDMSYLCHFAKHHNIPIIFDSVEVGFGQSNGKMVGGFGEAEVFSVHASKLLNGFEGGYVTTNNFRVYAALREIAEFEMHEAHIAMTLASLEDLSDQIGCNKTKYATYVKNLDMIPGITQVKYSEKQLRSFKSILVKLNELWPISREQTIDLMHKENMLVRPYYYPPLTWKKHSYAVVKEKAYLVADQITMEYLLLPSGECVSHRDVQDICELLLFIQEHGDEIKKRLESD